MKIWGISDFNTACMLTGLALAITYLKRLYLCITKSRIKRHLSSVGSC